LKGALENIFEALGISDYSFDPAPHFMLEAGRSCEIRIGKEVAGFLGQISDGLEKKYDVHDEIFIAEIDLNLVLKAVPNEKRYRSLAKYPKVSRDIAMFVPQNVSHNSIVSVIRSVGAPILEVVELFDRYKGKQVPQGYVSLAYSLDYRNPAKTLTDVEVNAKHEEVLKALIRELKVSVRTQ
jgi:phenylalanyl-tRNA synthetase beta chain